MGSGGGTMPPGGQPLAARYRIEGVGYGVHLGV